MVNNGTVIPITATANTATTIVSVDLTAGNSTSFPQLANQAKGFDKISWKRVKMSFRPNLPTTAGGSVGMYFDTDRTDTPPTSISEVMQNRGARMCATWDKMDYNIPSAMLKGVNQWYTTLSTAGTGAVSTNNTFASPGRIHVLITPQPGVTFATSTVVGYLEMQYSAELGFPTNPADSAVPTRRFATRSRPVGFHKFNSDLVDRYQHFAAGCQPVPSFWDFLDALDGEGCLQLSKLSQFDPDDLSRDILRLRVSPLSPLDNIELNAVQDESSGTPAYEVSLFCSSIPFDETDRLEAGSFISEDD